ncbi:ras-associated and pleckstrin homology domains-containing protein 1 [Bubalus bubalis]|uniref:ras-associated and pleckstrin homology domains-containing protein 1 n=1 Tax=Bubalus bubalis TaxID=89462 RepID=UPI001D110726|nr:ras-associated and pleckstrin homology domains-containing protein 1 [Bubalus bubalis]
MGRPAPPPPARPPPAAPAPRPEPRPPFPAPPSGALFPAPPAAAQLSQFSLWGRILGQRGWQWQTRTPKRTSRSPPFTSELLHPRLLVTKDGSDTPPTPERKEERSLLEQPASWGEQEMQTPRRQQLCSLQHPAQCSSPRQLMSVGECVRCNSKHYGFVLVGSC